MGAIREVRVLDDGEACPELPIIEGEGIARAIVWPGVGAELRSMNRISLPAGCRTVELRHPMEAVYYIMGGGGVVLDTAGRVEQSLVEGSMVHVEPDTAYLFEAGPDGVELLGGACPADPSMYDGLMSK